MNKLNNSFTNYLPLLEENTRYMYNNTIYLSKYAPLVHQVIQVVFQYIGMNTETLK